MRFFNWVYITGAVLIVILALSGGFIVASLIALVAVALTLPPIWDRLKCSLEDTWPKTRGAFSVIFILVALGVTGNEFSKTPEGISARIERENHEIVENKKLQAEELAEKRKVQADELAEKRSVQAKEAAKVAVIHETSKKGFDCLSGWDGSHRGLVNYVRQRLRNPSSFEHIETSITPVDKKGHHLVVMKYRAENGFGGMNVEAVPAVINHEICDLVEVIM